MSTKAIDLKFGTINVPRKVGKKGAESCWENMAGRADAFVINETLAGWQRRVYANLIREHGWKQRGLYDSPNPIFVNPDVWQITFHETYRMHARLSLWKVWPGYNAARYNNVTCLRHRQERDLRATPMGTHWAPRGQKVKAAARERAWDKSEDEMNTRIENQDERGRFSIPMGDFNMDRNPDLNGAHWLTGKQVDKIAVVVPDGWRMLPASRSHNFKADTDHGHGVSALVRVERVLDPCA